MNSKLKKIILALIILVLVGIGAVLIQQNTGFRVVSRDPSGNVPLSVTQVSFTLSHKITNKDAVKLSILPNIDGTFTIKDTVVIFSPDVPFEDKKTYKLSVQNASIENDTKKHTTTHNFTAAYVPYNQLSDAEKARQMLRTNPVQQKYPVTRDLPYVTSSFKIEYTPPLHEEDPIIISVTPLIVQSRGESTEQYQARLLVIKDEVESYLKEKGHDPSTYKIFYQDIFLLQYSTASYTDDDDGHEHY